MTILSVLHEDNLSKIPKKGQAFYLRTLAPMFLKRMMPGGFNSMAIFAILMEPCSLQCAVFVEILCQRDADGSC